MLLKYWSHKRHWDIAWEGFIFGNLKVYTVKALILSADFKKKHRCIILWFYDLWLIYATCIALTLIANVGGVHECGGCTWMWGVDMNVGMYVNVGMYIDDQLCSDFTYHLINPEMSECLFVSQKTLRNLSTFFPLPRSQPPFMYTPTSQSVSMLYM